MKLLTVKREDFTIEKDDKDGNGRATLHWSYIVECEDDSEKGICIKKATQIAKKIGGKNHLRIEGLFIFKLSKNLTYLCKLINGEIHGIDYVRDEQTRELRRFNIKGSF